MRGEGLLRGKPGFQGDVEYQTLGLLGDSPGSFGQATAPGVTHDRVAGERPEQPAEIGWRQEDPSRHFVQRSGIVQPCFGKNDARSNRSR